MDRLNAHSSKNAGKKPILYSVTFKIIVYLCAIFLFHKNPIYDEKFLTDLLAFL